MLEPITSGNGIYPSCCSNCRFSYSMKNPQEIGKSILECRKGPPYTTIALPNREGLAIISKFPVVSKDDNMFCYGHEPCSGFYYIGSQNGKEGEGQDISHGE